MICTGRSDYPEPGQQRPVLPLHLPRRARCRRDHDQRGDEARRGARRSPQLAREAPSDVVARGLWRRGAAFGPDSLIPSPFDPRLILRIAPAVAKAAMDSGVATRPIADFDAYAERLTRFVFRSGFIMKPLFAQAKAAPEARRSTPRARTSACCAPRRSCVEERLAKPILIGRPAVIEARIKRFGLSIRPGSDFELDQSRGRSALPRLRRRPIVDVAGRRGHHAGRGAHAGAHQRHGDRRARGAARRGGRHDLRRSKAASRAHLRHIRDIIGLAPGVERLCGAERW